MVYHVARGLVLIPEDAMSHALCPISGGLQFRTPEAITAVNTFRACHYLRAMAIWGLWATDTDWAEIPGASER